MNESMNVDATREWSAVRFGVWPEDLDCDGALRETSGALDTVVSTWIDIRNHYRETMTDLTKPAYGRVKEVARHMGPRVTTALGRLDKARVAIIREREELAKRHAPKLGNLAETMIEGEVRSYLRSLPEPQLVLKLGEAIVSSDLVTLRAVLLAPPVLLPLPEGLMRSEIEDGYAQAIDPEGSERRGLLDRADSLIERSGRNFMEETSKLLPTWLANASPNDKNAAGYAERLAEQEQQRAIAEARIVTPPSIPPLSARIGAEIGA